MLEGIEGGLRAQLGALGSFFVRPFLNSAKQKFKENVRAVDSNGPDQYLGHDSKHYLVSLAEVNDAVLRATGGLSTVYGKLEIGTSSKGKLKFDLPTPEDMNAAVESLKGRIADRLILEAEWDESKGEFVKT